MGEIVDNANQENRLQDDKLEVEILQHRVEMCQPFKELVRSSTMVMHLPEAADEDDSGDEEMTQIATETEFAYKDTIMTGPQLYRIPIGLAIPDEAVSQETTVVEM